MLHPTLLYGALAPRHKSPTRASRHVSSIGIKPLPRQDSFLLRFLLFSIFYRWFFWSPLGTHKRDHKHTFHESQTNSQRNAMVTYDSRDPNNQKYSFSLSSFHPMHDTVAVIRRRYGAQRGSVYDECTRNLKAFFFFPQGGGNGRIERVDFH